MKKPHARRLTIYLVIPVYFVYIVAVMVYVSLVVFVC